MTFTIATPLRENVFPAYTHYLKSKRNSERSQEMIQVKKQKAQAISLQQDQSLLFLSLGNSDFGSGKFVAAVTDYTHALEVNPNNAAAYYNRGEVRSKLGDKKGAIADLKKALDIFKSQGEQDNYQDALNHLKQLQNS
ncbi:tetratricopeptide repeat protein [Aetokthonos hydrillicola CCALA 1050]|nr:tetratricopeptide repeat protein [Aetokthonos hydrillicola CCALA 1050]